MKILLPFVGALFMSLAPAQADNVSGKLYRCVDDSTNEVLDEDLNQLPGDLQLDLVFNKYPGSNFLIPRGMSNQVGEINTTGVIEFVNEGSITDASGTTFNIYLEVPSFGGNFTDTLRVVIDNDTEQEESVSTFLCEPY